MNDLQEIELSILKAVISACEKHGLRYYALGGTLLGAVRHQGFIPWDDDIDIAMPRPDYDRFLQIAESELPQNLVPTSYANKDYNQHRPTYFCCVKDTNTSIEMNWAVEAEITNAWIDIFPLDPMPGNTLLRTIRKYHLLYRRMCVQFSMYDEGVHQHRPNRPLHERMLMRFREKTKIGSNWSPYEMYAKAERVTRSLDYSKGEYVVNLFGAYKFREMWPKDWFGNGVEMRFEDISIMCPTNTHGVLQRLYGDYMQLPPIEQRGEQHRLTIIKLEIDNRDEEFVENCK